MNIDDYCQGINMSRDYSALYHLLIQIGEPKDGRGIPCYVDYDCDRSNPNSRKLRDIAAAKFWPLQKHFAIGARGIGYGDIIDYKNLGAIPSLEEFVNVCAGMNLEWVSPFKKQVSPGLPEGFIHILDKLPCAGDNVEVYTKEGNITTAIFQTFLGNHWETVNSRFEDETVIGWKEK
jgi:hypothetical protein